MTPKCLRFGLTWMFLGYLITGTIYYVSGYLYSLSIGKEIVFTHIIGFPMTLISWPWMVYADLIHHQTLGLKIPTILALVSVIFFTFYVIIKIIKHQYLH